MRSVLKFWCVPVFVSGWTFFVPSLAVAGTYTGPTVAMTGPYAGTVQPSMYSLLKDAFGAGSPLVSAANKVAGSAATGEVLIAEAAKGVVIGGAGGPTVDMTLTRTLSWDAAKKLGARALPLVGTAMTGYSIYSAYRCYASAGSVVQSVNAALAMDGGVSCDSGQSTVTGTQYRGCRSPYCGGWSGTRLEALASLNATMNAAAETNQCGQKSPVWESPSVGPSPSFFATAVRHTPSCTNTYLNGTWVYVAGTGTYETIEGYASYGQQSGPVCPAYTLNGVAHPAGEPPGPDGKCPTGGFTPMTPDQVSAQIGAGDQNAKDQAASIAKEAMKQGADPGTELSGQSGTLSGPASVNGPSSTVTTTPTGGTATTTTTTPTYNITYTNNTFIWNSTTTTASPTGTTTTSGTATDKPKDPCGLPGTPACKIDESGTDTAQAMDTSAADAVKARGDAKLSEVIGGITGPTFGFIGAPPIAECTPFDYPNFNGQPMGSVNPCGVVGDVRAIMAYLWALGGFWLCIGWIREAANA